MMTLNYGVCPEHAAPHKGYRDVVQQTDPVISGLLRVNNINAQILIRRKPSVQLERNPLTRLDCAELERSANLLILPIPVRGTELPDSPILSTSTNGESWLNLLIFPKSCAAGSRDTKLDEAPSLEVQTVATTCTQGIQKEKGHTANAALWDDGFFHHEEIQYSSDLSDGDTKALIRALEQNQYLAEQQDNLPSLRGIAHCLQPSFSQSQNHTGISGEVDCISLRDVVQLSTYETFVGQPSGDSLAFFRCRRLISPIAALTKKAAVLSLSSFTDSISCSTSCGTLTFTCFDLLFIEPVAISGLLGNRCDSVYAKKRAVQCLTCYSPSHKVNSTLIMSGYQNGNAPECGNTTEASNQTVTKDNDMACLHDTQTRPEKTYLWRFIALERSDLKSEPCRLSVEAATEREARRILAPYFILSLAARLPPQGGVEITTPSTIEKTSMEVRYAC